MIVEDDGKEALASFPSVIIQEVYPDPVTYADLPSAFILET